MRNEGVLVKKKGATSVEHEIESELERVRKRELTKFEQQARMHAMIH